MIEKNELFQDYANEFVNNVPMENLQKLVALFMREAAINMGVTEDKTTLERTVYYIKKEFGYIPVNYIASAFVRGSLGKIGDGKGRLVPKTILTWLGDTSLDYNRMMASEREKNNQNDVSVAMDLHKFPVGKAIQKKIDWLSKGIIKPDDWERVPIKILSEMIAKGEHPTPMDFGINYMK